MKKPRLHILVLATCIFAAFLAGFFAGRNLNRTPVQIRTLPAPTEPAPPAEETQPEVPGIVNLNSALHRTGAGVADHCLPGGIWQF